MGDLLTDRAEQEAGESTSAPGSDDKKGGTLRFCHQCGSGAARYQLALHRRDTSRVHRVDGGVEDLLSVPGELVDVELSHLGVASGERLMPDVDGLDNGIAPAGFIHSPLQRVPGRLRPIHPDDDALHVKVLLMN